MGVIPEAGRSAAKAAIRDPFRNIGEITEWIPALVLRPADAR